MGNILGCGPAALLSPVSCVGLKAANVNTNDTRADIEMIGGAAAFFTGFALAVGPHKPIGLVLGIAGGLAAVGGAIDFSLNPSAADQAKAGQAGG
jgi:hypothetical protein